ncbi:MAG: DNA recombination/repair protein RecA, partial [Patescibacteria group bacterium]
ISKEGAIIDVGLEMGILQKSGAFIRIGETMLGQGKEASKLFLKENSTLAHKITEEILKVNKSGGTPVAVGVEEQEPAE